MKRIALIGDMVQSRAIKDRKGAQTALTRILSELNETSPYLLSPYTITLGDEFQCLRERADGVFHDISRIITAFHPEKMRFSLGIGELVTEINPNMAIGMDGPAYYNARDGMEILKNGKSLIIVKGLPEEADILLRNVLALVSELVYDLNKNQHYILMSILEERSVADMSDQLGISKQAIYKSIRTHSLEEIAGTLTAVERTLNVNL